MRSALAELVALQDKTKGYSFTSTPWPLDQRETWIHRAAGSISGHVHAAGQTECADACEQWAEFVWAVGQRLADLDDAGTPSCVWHEVAARKGTACHCAKCERMRGVA